MKYQVHEVANGFGRQTETFTCLEDTMRHVETSVAAALSCLSNTSKTTEIVITRESGRGVNKHQVVVGRIAVNHGVGFEWEE